MSMDYNWLAQELERQRRREDQQQLRERRDFEALGLDYGMVMQARREAAAEALQRAAQAQGTPYQPPLPGLNPALMAIRATDQPLTPLEQAAAGIAGAGWQRSPEYVVHEQPDLETMLAHNGIKPIQRPAPAAVLQEALGQAEAAPVPRGALGRRMARYGLPALGALLALHGIGTLMDAASSGQQEVMYA